MSRNPILSLLIGQGRLEARKEGTDQAHAIRETLHFGPEISKVYSGLIYLDVEVFIQRSQPSRILVI